MMHPKGGNMERVLMKCGCVAQGTCSKSRGVDFDPPIPCCVIHDCLEPAESVPDLTGRKALCSYGKDGGKYKHTRPYNETKSDFNLAFFEYHPESKYDTYYCGCWGWD